MKDTTNSEYSCMSFAVFFFFFENTEAKPINPNFENMLRTHLSRLSHLVTFWKNRMTSDTI